MNGLSAWSEAAGRAIAAAIARELVVDDRPLAWLAFAAQAKHECADGDANVSAGAGANNPLNLTGSGWPGQTGFYVGGDSHEWHADFARFPTLELGAAAAAANYTTHDPAGYYRGVVNAFQAGDPVAIAQAIEDSPWDSGHYGQHLDDEVRELLALNPQLEDPTMNPEQFTQLLEKFDAQEDSYLVYVARQQRGLDVVTGKPLDPNDRVDPAAEVARLRAGG